MPNMFVVEIVLLAIVVLAIFTYIGSAAILWLRAMFSGAGIGFMSIIFMRLRKISSKEIVEAKIMAVKAGLNLTTEDLETHYLAGGNALSVVRALVAAKKTGASLTFNQAAAIDLERALRRL